MYNFCQQRVLEVYTIKILAVIIQSVIDQYLIGKNIMPTDPIIWFNKISSQNLDHYCTQNWVRAKKMIEDSLLKPKC